MTNFRQVLERRKGRLEQAQFDFKSAEGKAGELRLQSIYCEEAQVIIQNIAQITQQQLEYHISEIVTLAMASVFDEPYELKVEFVQRRNRTEADIWFVRNDEKIDPMTACGGGTVDIASFALRVALWSLSKPRTSSILILDEPMRFVSRNYQSKTSAMLKTISEKLGLQIIMVSHSEDLIESADNHISVNLRKGISYVK